VNGKPSILDPRREIAAGETQSRQSAIAVVAVLRIGLEQDHAGRQNGEALSRSGSEYCEFRRDTNTSMHQQHPQARPSGTSNVWLAILAFSNKIRGSMRPANAARDRIPATSKSPDATSCIAMAAERQQRYRGCVPRRSCVPFYLDSQRSSSYLIRPPRIARVDFGNRRPSIRPSDSLAMPLEIKKKQPCEDSRSRSRLSTSTA